MPAERRVVVLDTETTGFSAENDRIVEVAAVEADVRFGPLSKQFHRVVNPGRSIPEAATRVHGLSDVDVRECKPFGEVAGDLIDFIRDGLLVVHNSSFDVAMLDAELHRARKPTLGEIGVEVLDSLEIAKNIMPLAEGHTLDDLCDAAAVRRSHRTKHGALTDARLLAETLPFLGAEYDRWTAMLECRGEASLDDALRALEHFTYALVRAEELPDDRLPYALASLVTLARWLVNKGKVLTDRWIGFVQSGGWSCKHYFATQRSAKIFSYKGAADALLVGLDLSPYQTKSYIYRVLPKIDEEIRQEVRKFDAALDGALPGAGAHSFAAAVLFVRSAKNICEKKRELLRDRFLHNRNQGYRTDVVSVTEGASTNTDYRRALLDLAPDADLGAFGKIHMRIATGSRSAEACARLFGGSARSGVNSIEVK